MSYVTGGLVMITINFAIDRGSRAAFAFADGLDQERARNEVLVNNMLPPIAAAKLKSGQVVADSYADASVIFIDIVGFSSLAKRVSPGHLIELLNAFFSEADHCTAECGVEKVKTIGDAYLAISGGNIPARNSADTAIGFALTLIDRLPMLRAKTGIEFQVRIGIHSGPVVGGVIGATRMAYDYWGETMNIAARIEGTSHADGIAVSEATYLRVHQTRSFEAPVTLMLKGVGETQVYRLLRPSVAELRLAS
jgi:class 3 adenylate cyclase